MCFNALLPIYPIPNFTHCGISSHPPQLTSELRIFYLQVKGDTGFIFASLKKTLITFISTLVRGDIEESPHIIYPFNDGEDSVLFGMDGRTRLMDPIPHTPILT